MHRGAMIHQMQVVLDNKLSLLLPQEASRPVMYHNVALILKDMALSILTNEERKVGNNEIFGDNRHHTN